MRKLRVGVIGAGFVARECHLPAYQARDDVDLVAICDQDREVAQAMAERFSIPRVLTDYKGLLAMKEIDAVSVCTPNVAHMRQTVAALAAGKHVLVEKPIAMSAAQGRKMLEAARKHRRKLMVAMNCRFSPAAQAVRSAVEQGLLGDIYFAKAIALRRRGIPCWGRFTEKKVSGGGPLIDIGVHALDLTLHLMGFPKPVSCSAGVYAKIGVRRPARFLRHGWDPRKFQVEDFAVGFVRFANGACLTLECSWAANLEGSPINSVLLGTKGGAQVEPLKFYTEWGEMLADVIPVSLPSTDMYHEEIRQFVECVRKDLPVPSTGEQAVVTTSILDATYASARRGREVRLA